MHKSQQRLPFLAFISLNDDDSSRCGDSYSGHQHTYTETVTEPDCERDGYTTYTCSCGYSYTDNVVPALGHDYVLAGQDGTTMTYACTRCGHTYTVIVPVVPNPPVEMSLRTSNVSVVTEHHEYVYASGTLLRETITTTDEDGNVTTETLDFVYDLNGSPYALNYTDGTAATQTYYYITNVQGDVTHLVTTDGAVVAEYGYDAWGKVTAATGTMAEVNPLRYRGYYYDAESGFYYVSSRYYDPAICRFVNADEAALIGVNGDFVSLNLFAYCGNSPAARKDFSGRFWNIVIGAVVGAAMELAGQLLSGTSLSEVNWAKVGVSAVSGGLTAAVGPVVGCLISGATDVAMDAIDGKINSVDDAFVSFAWGTAKAVVSYGVGTYAGKKLKSLAKIESVGKMGDAGYPGVKYSYNKGRGRAIRSIELHPRHGGHGIHIQINKWNPVNGKRAGVVLRKTLWE